MVGIIIFYIVLLPLHRVERNVIYNIDTYVFYDREKESAYVASVCCVCKISWVL